MASSQLLTTAVEDIRALITKCKQERSFAHALSLHNTIHGKELEADPSLGPLLISMWVELGSMHHAHQVFDKLMYKNSSSWKSLIKGYVNCGEPQHALNLYGKMQRDSSLQPDGHTLVALLKACAMLRDLERGHSIYLEIVAKGCLGNNLFIASTLVDMYAKCGSLSKAQDIFDKLPFKDIVLWTALIQGYKEYGPAKEALRCLEQMQDEGISPDAAALVCVTKACGSIGATTEGLELHHVITRMGLLEESYLLGSSLVDMYCKFGMLAEAKKVFDVLSVQDVVSWTALMAGYAEHGRGKEALRYLEKMQHDSVLPSSVTFVCGLKACGNTGAESKGQELHAKVFGTELDTNIYIGSALVDMYVKCASLTKAQKAFDRLPVQNVVAWNALLTGYAEHGLGEEVLSYFDKMQEEGYSPDSVTLVCGLKACSIVGDINKGREIHANIIKKSLENDIITNNTLIDMYVKCGSLEEAEDVFTKLSFHNVVSWTALITGYVELKYSEKALNSLIAMKKDGICPSAATFVCSLKACSIAGEIKKGQELHAEIAMFGLEKELLVSNTLVDLYATCGLFIEASQVFDKLPVRDVVGWNALISGFVEHGYHQDALDCIAKMQHEDVSPDPVTFLCSLKACYNEGASDSGKELHAEITKQGLSDKDASLYNSLVGMYTRFGLLPEAQKVFDSPVVRSVVTWNALVAAYAECGYGEEALKCYEQMECDGISPDAITLVCILKTCGSIEAREKGQKIHAFAICKGLETEPLVGNTLVFMYVKCGLVATAHAVFDKLLVHNVVSWTALLAGYAQLGESEDVFRIHDGMVRASIRPDLVTFGSVLSGCSYSGHVEEGQMFFEVMCKDHGLTPTFWHHICLIDLLGRSGHVEKAVALTERMPFHPGSLAWHIVMGACRKQGNMELGIVAFKHALQIDEQDASAYVCMSNIYREAFMLEEAKWVEAMLLKSQVGRTLELDLSTDPDEAVQFLLVDLSLESYCAQIREDIGFLEMVSRDGVAKS